MIECVDGPVNVMSNNLTHAPCKRKQKATSFVVNRKTVAKGEKKSVGKYKNTKLSCDYFPVFFFLDIIMTLFLQAFVLAPKVDS